MGPFSVFKIEIKENPKTHRKVAFFNLAETQKRWFFGLFVVSPFFKKAKQVAFLRFAEIHKNAFYCVLLFD